MLASLFCKRRWKNFKIGAPLVFAVWYRNQIDTILYTPFHILEKAYSGLQGMFDFVFCIDRCHFDKAPVNKI